MGRGADLGRPADASALAGTRALLLDMDGVIVARGQPIPGASEAMARLNEAAIPYRVITNTSLSTRSSLARRLAAGGIDIAADRIVTALSATVARLAAEMPGATIYLLGSADAPAEFADTDLRLVADADLDAEASVDAVVVGDSEDRLTYENLNRAFRQIRLGSAFIAMHRNPWWLTPAGPTLDSGALVVGLEYATGRRATVAGKPSPTIFREAFDELAREIAGRTGGGARLGRHDATMVGDDPRTDLAPARRLGMRTALVLTGKLGRTELAAALARPRAFVPDAVADSIADVATAVLPRGGE